MGRGSLVNTYLASEVELGKTPPPQVLCDVSSLLQLCRGWPRGREVAPRARTRSRALPERGRQFPRKPPSLSPCPPAPAEILLQVKREKEGKVFMCN